MIVGTYVNERAVKGRTNGVCQDVHRIFFSEIPHFRISADESVAVFLVVQAIIDFIVTPKIMGKAMGLNPAILLLSLSVWGALLGFIGLIIALPLTTLIIAYYKRYVTKDEEKVEEG